MSHNFFGVNDVNPAVNWNEDLDYFVIAGCSVLKPDPTNGFAWGNATLKQGILQGLCGYYDSAPSDTGGIAVEIAQKFTAYLTSQTPPNHTGTGDRILNAWLEANMRAEHDQKAIVYDSSNYWYVDTFGSPSVEGPFPW